MKRMTRLPLLLLLALVLLFAQQGAALHALSHLAERLPEQSRQDKQLPHSPACDKCVVYAEVEGALASGGMPLPFVAAPAFVAATMPAARLSCLDRAYHARAPPLPA